MGALGIWYSLHVKSMEPDLVACTLNLCCFGGHFGNIMTAILDLRHGKIQMWLISASNSSARVYWWFITITMNNYSQYLNFCLKFEYFGGHFEFSAIFSKVRRICKITWQDYLNFYVYAHHKDSKNHYVIKVSLHLTL